MQLRSVSEGMPFFCQDPPFSLKDYFIDMMEKMKVHHPKVFTQCAPIIHFVEEHFLDIHDQLPMAFSHGDYHCLNIIWSGNGIVSVIDWEFAGYKPDIYDVANMLGCLGIEDPRSLVGNFATVFLALTRKEGIFSHGSYNAILEFMVALRFAWLAEWLRNRDHEMIGLELDYMKLLIRNRHAIRKKWGIEEE